MTNVCVDETITVFRAEDNLPDHNSQVCSSEYLRKREMAERAAAKHSTTLVARRIHQQLALLYSGQRHGNRGAPNAG
jgi:hypothetical protein